MKKFGRKIKSKQEVFGRKIDLKKGTCYLLTNPPKEADGYVIAFIPSGYEGVWLKVFESYDYLIGVDYASVEENKALNKQRRLSDDKKQRQKVYWA